MTRRERTQDDVEHLTTAECWRLLEQAELGRLAVSATDGKPDVFPLNFVARSGHLYLRTAPGAKLADLTGAADVAFEVDGTDGTFRWSVVVRARADTLRLLDDAPLEDIPTAHPSGKSIVVRLVPTTVTGRRFRDARVTTRRTTPRIHEPSDRKPVPIPHFPPPKKGTP
ncbi:nitroimidazol reductase NimA-like FMN-containing flavoprotein (pyridoxamine 5'-phosphate oxidase superfamily) [Labedella gwakjiensis]|uniref:Nitroimidazol reductase NimA-like FMN-containing flavoprotein (Pyridoxamine 5'-phosphate oxidase superfamily) n=1 Tax=Labedella gwakjiensis TaxID=390269 RepID=A0A2P8GT80_9MICO|nr:pyridoxamine 5'-phosphate oxidase family protein [Labedella gwakjiensis]PSL37155.1 nitroimidazol reductase NimA-like FMN-containing flavoprotein (pyridoxamine 5'-phosphate oxidase superfamily) [Labedella gwakjiensis]RUQ81946.1 pyridoxamine 5'-phosphate oxidase family protein [Labedella gwakjiensis]